MSIWGRVAAGIGSGAGALASRYIDEELLTQREQAISDIRRKTAQQMTEDADAFNSNPDRVARNLNNKVAEENAIGGARNKIALDGEVARASNTQLRQAKIDDANQITLGTVDAQVEAQNKIVNGTASAKLKAEVDRMAALLPLEIKKAYATASASASASAKYREAPGAEFAARLAITQKTLGRELTENEKLALTGLGSKGRDPELDTISVTTEKRNPDGTFSTTSEKRVRRPGEASQTEQVDPIRAKMEADRAAKAKAAGAADPFAVQSPIAGRPLLRVSSADLQAAMSNKNKRLSSYERQEITMELDRRKSGGDIKGF